MRTQAEKGAAFAALHARAGAFLIPNPWDIGTARLLAHSGFEALATTSAGYAFSAGQIDNAIGRDESLAHAAEIASATDLPVSADLENCFGDSSEAAAETIRLAAKAGLAGASIEDMPRHSPTTVYEMSHAVERVRAAAEAAHGLPFRFTLTARTENYLVGRPDLKDTIARLQAYQAAGADVLYAPGLTSKEDIAALVRSVNRPVNVLAVPHFSVADLAEIGVKRISVGSLLTRAAYGAFLRAAKEMRERGTFSFAAEAVSFRDLTEIFETIHSSRGM
ncbi:MAG TPA: isocitrate lyase/phosphoenolpyruvate mutase family protein [Candidatus Acidoferrales bacterium]|nr:isocitrate lyase/phosphoenolpyruvate mutase family protein [Candidatus Acidoferrales bacterium]